MGTNKVVKVTLDGREVVSREDGEHVTEVRVYVARVYGPGVVHVGSGLCAESAVNAALGYATACGTRAAEVKQMRRDLESGASGRVIAMPRGVTHFGVGPDGSCWLGGSGETGKRCVYNAKTFKWEVTDAHA